MDYDLVIIQDLRCNTCGIDFRYFSNYSGIQVYNFATKSYELNNDHLEAHNGHDFTYGKQYFGVLHNGEAKVYPMPDEARELLNIRYLLA